ncbi:MAG: hypothetical protein AAB703_00870, partial [Pseudomonadota bacterium]
QVICHKISYPIPGIYARHQLISPLFTKTKKYIPGMYFLKETTYHQANSWLVSWQIFFSYVSQLCKITLLQSIVSYYAQ